MLTRRRPGRLVAAAVAAALVPATAVAGAGARAQAMSGGAGAAAAGVISTVAGGVGGPAKATRVALHSSCGVAFGAGALYIGDDTAVRKVSPASDELTTPAGTGVNRPFGSRGLATAAGLSGACGVAVDHAGNLVIADGGGHRHNGVRVVAAATGSFYGQAMRARHIYTVAGTGMRGFSGDGGPATSAEFRFPSAVAVDGAGNLVIADLGNNRVRVVAVKTGEFYGRSMIAGDIYTVAGDGQDGAGGDGGRATRAQLSLPEGLAVDGAGNLVIVDRGDSVIRVVAVKTGVFYGQSMIAGDIYTVAGTGTSGFSGDGGPATSAELSFPWGVAVDGAGNLVIGDSGNNRVRVVAVKTGVFYGRSMIAGDIYTVAGDGQDGAGGDGGPATSAELSFPGGVAVDGAGNLIIANTYGSGDLRVRVVAVKTGAFYGQSMTSGDIYTLAGNGNDDFSGDGLPATRAELHAPDAVTVDGVGNVIISDPSNHRIRVAAAATGTFYGQPMTAGDMYTVAGDGTSGFSGDGGPATHAELAQPTGVAVDGAGNLIISDYFDCRIRVVAAATGMFYGQSMIAGDIYTVAGTGAAGFSGDGGPATSAELNSPGGVGVDGAGNLIIADSSNQRIRVVATRTGIFYGQSMIAGDIYTVAGSGGLGFSGDGGPATSAEMAYPDAVAVDSAGNLLIADELNSRIRVVAARTGIFYGQSMIAGDIYTVAGDSQTGFSGDGGPATSAELNSPDGVAVDAAGNLIIADELNDRIRVVAARTGIFYGQSMTAGDIYTVAGTGTYGFSGDGGPATSAELTYPEGVAVGAGNLLIADEGNDRIREVAG